MIKPERILVCGGRDYDDVEHIEGVLFACVVKGWFEHDFCIIEGGATGADTHARLWAQRNGHCSIRVDANWDFHGRRRAGPIRNGWMRKFCQPQLVIAFPGRTGTAGMVALAKATGIPVYAPRR